MKTNVKVIAWPLTLAATFWLGLELSNRARGASDMKSNSKSPISLGDSTSTYRASGQGRDLMRHSNRSSKAVEESYTIRLKNLIEKMDSLSASELRTLLTEHVQEQGARTHGLELSLIIERLIAKDPIETLNFLYKNPNSTIESQIDHGLFTFAKTHPQKAMNWVRSKSWGYNANGRVTNSVIKGTAETNVKQAMEFIFNLKYTFYRNEVVRKISHRIAELPIEESWEWVTSNAPITTSHLIKNLSAEKLPKLANLISEKAQVAEEVNLARGWAMVDPDAAMKWISQLPAERSSKAASSSLWELAGRRPEEVSQWIEQYAEADNYGSMNAILVAQSYKKYPELAASKLRHVKSNKRPYYRNLIYERLLQIDEATAKRFIVEDRKLYTHKGPMYDPNNMMFGPLRRPYYMR